MEKMTYVSVLNDVLAMGVLNVEQTEKINSLITSLEKRSSYKSDKPTKTQIENERIKDRMINSMVAEMKYTVADMIEMFPCLVKEDGTKFSSQKVSSLAHALVNENRLDLVEVKRKSYFSLKK